LASYTHADGRIILHSWGRFRALAVSAIKAGDLLYQKASEGVELATHTTTASALTTVAQCVACEDIKAAATGWVALAVEIKDPPTIATGGVVSQGSLCTAGDEGEPLWLSGTAGQATITAPTAGQTVIKQRVGYITAIDRVLLRPEVVGLALTA